MSMNMDVLNVTISQLIQENFGYAAALDYYGINFQENEKQTLNMLCMARGISPEWIIERVQNQQIKHPDFRQWSIESIIRYLKVNHSFFTRFKLPYISKLIFETESEKFSNPQVGEDLKLIFPVFAEDFIKHIHEEEDTLFSYIHTLLEATRHIHNVADLLKTINHNSIQKLNLAHESHDDEMEGIRKLTNNFDADPVNDLYEFVIYQELKSFEQDLHLHAHIENYILFPKALKLENEVRWRIEQKIKLN